MSENQPFLSDHLSVYKDPAVYTSDLSARMWIFGSTRPSFCQNFNKSKCKVPLVNAPWWLAGQKFGKPVTLNGQDCSIITHSMKIFLIKTWAFHACKHILSCVQICFFLPNFSMVLVPWQLRAWFWQVLLLLHCNNIVVIFFVLLFFSGIWAVCRRQWKSFNPSVTYPKNLPNNYEEVLLLRELLLKPYSKANRLSTKSARYVFTFHV